MWMDVPRKAYLCDRDGNNHGLRAEDADHYTHVADVPTGFRARTSILVPELNRLYVAVSGKGKPDANSRLQIYEIQP